MPYVVTSTPHGSVKGCDAALKPPAQATLLGSSGRHAKGVTSAHVRRSHDVGSRTGP